MVRGRYGPAALLAAAFLSDWTGGAAAADIATVAVTGEVAPGTGGARFSGLKEPVLNSAGEVAFDTVTSYSAKLEVRGRGILAGRPGSLRLIVRGGERIEVAPNDVRKLEKTRIFFAVGTGNEDGRSSGFSEGGQVAFSAGFKDGSSGIFLSPPDGPKVHLLTHRPVSEAWDQVFLPRSLKRPVIIAGPPTRADSEPGVVRLRKIQGAKSRFHARFQEWDHLDGVHSEERTDFLVMNQGRRRQADDSLWEAGTVKLTGNRGWVLESFSQPFPGVPRVFATVQSSKDAAAVAARVRNVTASRFEVSIQEQELDLAGGHGEEKVGYLAVYSKKGKGTIAGGVDGTEYRLKQAEVGDGFKRVLGQRIRLEEEQSQDAETSHADEAVTVMTLGRGLFAQQASRPGARHHGDPAAAGALGGGAADES